MPVNLHPKTFSFLKDIKKHNNKPWFDKHKPLYEEVKNDFVDFMDAVIKQANKFDKSIGEQEAKKAVYRIYRDVRFSKDKTPYKSNMAAGFGRGGRKSRFAGYYLHIQPNGESYIGAGVWHPEPEDMKKIRQEIDYNLADYKKIINKKSFAKQFGEAYEDKQKTVPQGYTADNPAIEILKYRSFLYGCDIDDKTVMSPNFIKEVIRILKELSPYIQFLNRGLE